MLKLDVLLWLLAALVPGWALIRLCWPAAGPLRTVACAPGISFGFCYGVGLLSSRLSISPVPAVLVTSAVAVLAAAVVGLRRRGPGRSADRPLSGARGWWLNAVHPEDAEVTEDAEGIEAAEDLGRRAADYVSWALLVAGIALGVALWRSFQSTMLVPIGWDAMHHGFFIEQISRYHTMKPAVVLASDARGSDGSGTFYPLAFNLDAAVLHVTTGGLISTIMLASTVALAGVLLPVGAFALARELDPRQPLVAGFAAITSVLPLLMYQIEGTGRLTGILGVALVPGLVVLLLSQRRGLHWTTLPLVSLGILGLAGLHTSEAPLAVLLAGVCLLVWRWQGGSWAGLRKLLLWLVAAGAASIVALVILEPDVLRLVSERGGAILAPTSRAGSQAWHSDISALGQAWALPVLGCAVSLLAPFRRFLGTAITLVLFMTLYFFVAVGTTVLVPTLAIPWYGDPGRISWDLTVLAAIPSAVGIAAIAGLLGRVTRSTAGFVAGPTATLRDRLMRWAPPAVAALIGILIVIAFALPPVGAEGRLASQTAGPVDQNSMAAFRYLAATVPPNEHVLDDLRSDGAMWMYVDYGVIPLFGNAPLLGAAPHSWLEKLWLSRNLNRINSNPCVRDLLTKYSIHYVYVGERHIYDGWTDFSVALMRKNHSFTEIFDRGNAHVFEVNPAPPVGSCRQNVTAKVRW